MESFQSMVIKGNDDKSCLKLQAPVMKRKNWTLFALYTNLSLDKPPNNCSAITKDIWENLSHKEPGFDLKGFS